MLLGMISQVVNPGQGPITTGAIFLALTGAITYLYRARDRDRSSEITRLERMIDDLRSDLQKERDK